ncbi:hypothetical protein FHX49_000018 [Microbacterium endophyticum]|uniref:Uncharacterized protein n=1 Tax=Microbacterium endophyticum TaxID=1526412 RepID=A0A7W4V081_9MICO|nr:hypothetical protein [Microbacterium endophyticum]NIK36774.1 hypothetical protein [Microbacterium endophyticum]
MSIATITRPRQGDLIVRIPYFQGHSNESLIRSILPDRAHVNRGERSGDWLVSRKQIGVLVAGLIALPEITDVELVLYQGREGGCASSCYLGSDSDEAIMLCACACIGLNHGAQNPPAGARHVATAGGAGDIYRYPGGRRRVMYSRLRDEFA